MEEKEEMRDRNYLMVGKQSFDSSHEVANLIHYVTRTGNCKKNVEDCICYGGHGVSISDSIELAIEQFKGIYGAYKAPRKGCRRQAYHEQMEIPYEYARRMSPEVMDDLAYWLSYHYWNRRYPVIYAVHGPGKSGRHFHIHFVVSMVSCRTGKKFDTSGKENRLRMQLFNRLMEAFAEARGLR